MPTTKKSVAAKPKKLKNMTEYLRAKLLTDYNIPEEVVDRYVKTLVNRALRFYINDHLDAITVDEDLYREDDEGDEVDYDVEYGYGNYVNLEYSENQDRKFLDENIKYVEEGLKQYENSKS